MESLEGRFPGDERNGNARVRHGYPAGPGQRVRRLSRESVHIQRLRGYRPLLEPGDEAVRLDRFEGGLPSPNELPEIAPGFEALHGDGDPLVGVLPSELEIDGREMEGEELIVELADPDRHPGPLRDRVADDVPDERLVEADKESRGGEDENKCAGGDGADAEDPLEPLLHVRMIRGQVSIFKLFEPGRRVPRPDSDP